MDLPEDETTLFEVLADELYAAVLSDVLDQLGYREQAMQATIRPLAPDMVVVGRAATQLAGEEYSVPDAPYERQIEAIDAVEAGQVVVATTQGSTSSAFWGELFSTATRQSGGRGAIIDGYVRDVRKIRGMGWPVFATGMRPIDSMGRLTVIDYNCPVRCGGVLVHPGDLIFGEIDGVVVVPRDVEAEAIERALEKVRTENTVRARLREGLTLRDAWDTYGVL